MGEVSHPSHTRFRNIFFERPAGGHSHFSAELAFEQTGVKKVRFWRRSSFRLAGAVGALVLTLASFGCRTSPEPVTVTFLDPEGLVDLGERHLQSEAALQEFTQQTGIRVNHLPAPEDNGEQVRLALELLQKGASNPDVYGVDTIWSGALSEYLIDLKPYFSSEMPSEDPDVLGSYVVDGKLAAMPYHPNMGVLYYRTDLLLKYRYSAPPKTWDELEKMAIRIQKGERASGKKDFWGFVWPGGISESISSNGLEWQIGEGGGRIIEADKKISVNNPDVIHAWERAARWVGWISPPSVLSYSEWDSSNAFWISGKAAFSRGWSDYFQRHPGNVPFRQKAGLTSVPAGKGARVSTLGGYALGVSRFSTHRPEAIKLIEFLAHRETEFEAANAHSEPPWQLQLYELPSMLSKFYPKAAKPGEPPGGKVVSRPSGVAGAKYDAVSRAYVQAARSVLTHQSTAPKAAAALEKELVRITGFQVVRR
jgi:trehalose/maltose transport system substrate-binding protein